MENAEAPREVVLVVDDSPGTLSMLTDVLEDEGMTVLVAIEGADALTAIEKVTPDAILLDAVMPHMDGFETARRMRRNQTMENVPIIFMTGLSDAGHVVRGFAAGGTDFVTKPIVPDELVARIRTHLSNARRAQCAQAALDASGRYLFAIDHEGAVLWATPQARRLISAQQDCAEELSFLPMPIREWVRHGGHPTQTNSEMTIPAKRPDGYSLSFNIVGMVGPGELLLRVTKTDPGRSTRLLRDRFALTQREAEVLLWTAQGKSNRDMAVILTLSPRTVNKHLEQIFTKLNVENRTAAAALAARTLE